MARNWLEKLGIGRNTAESGCLSSGVTVCYRARLKMVVLCNHLDSRATGPGSDAVGWPAGAYQSGARSFITPANARYSGANGTKPTVAKTHHRRSIVQQAVN